MLLLHSYNRLLITLLFIGLLSLLTVEVAASAEAPQALNQADVIWIDVRSSGEFEQGHLKSAINIPHTVIGEKISSVTKDKNQPIKLYCRSGKRAGMANNTLQQLGYTNVVNMGGYSALKKDYPYVE